MDDGVRLIYMYFIIVNYIGLFFGEVYFDVFEFFWWICSIGIMGWGIMMLKNIYNIFFMNILNYEVEYMYDIVLV